ncbi:MAG: hypothetical protein JRE18_00725 [Deltaproteobacteria bacterium]|jgi:hypothetical protein|nr:hypothetical protein [Deltaproteobacteria bacterium]
MKKKIIIISAVLIGFVLTVSGNSWAGRERGGERHRNRSGHFQKWDKPAVHKLYRGHGRDYHHNYGPVHRFTPKSRKGHHYRAPHRNWRHRPYYRHWKFKRHYWRHHRRPVINNYYSSSEGYAAPEEEFNASASVSDSGFSVSVGVNKTN